LTNGNYKIKDDVFLAGHYLNFNVA